MLKLSVKFLVAVPALLGVTVLSASAAWAAASETSAPALAQVEAANQSSTPIKSVEVKPVEAAPVIAQAAPAQEASPMRRINTVTDLESPAAPSATSNPLGQITSVSQLSDVQPTDWAFQALQSLVERYGCIQGYPNRTYRGTRSLSRYEFAAGLNACMDRVNELIAAGTANLVKKSDLAKLQKLQEEFAAELATLRGRVDALEARTATLEAQQFSTTTKLQGDILFTLAGVVDGDNRTAVSPTGTTGTVGENTIFGYRGRLNLITSFSGKDRLRTRLQFGNLTAFSGGVTGTNMTRLGADGGDGSIVLDDLTYRFPVFGDSRLTIAAKTEFDRFFDTLAPFESC